MEVSVIIFTVYLTVLLILFMCAVIDDLCIKHSDTQIFILYAQSDMGSVDIKSTMEWKEIK